MQFEIIPKVYADCEPGSGVNLSECLLLSNNTPIKDTYSTPAFLVNLIVTNLFIFAGLILFVLILVAGFKFITGGKKGMDEAKTLITTGITGFLIMFSAYWIVQIIERLTGATIPL